ncbi:MAG TPA: carotenoid biosynthesis protein, partial [Candidatus Sulfopaludibacter sp.]|nr:carotenoid biosynthesis protein [Candidatus Sulfopaludibacter sp.]
YAAARFLPVFPRAPMVAIVALHVLPPCAFVVIHGARAYGLRGIAVFSALCLGVGSSAEIVGIRTGFPFGHYRFTDVMGPKFLEVPYLLALAYLGMGYLSWTLAHAILGPPRNWRLIAVPLVASVAMVSWDVCCDPVWSTIVRAWTWTDGGPYFGVPLTNFTGWFLTAFVYYQSFALYLWSRKSAAPGDSGIAILMYAISAAGNLLLAIPRPAQAVVADPVGIHWSVLRITQSCAMASVLLMGGFAALAWWRLRGPVRTKPAR